MAQIILDISANTHRNNEQYYMEMINELAEVDTRKHEIILKWQLFGLEGNNIIPNKAMFVKKSWWAFRAHGYKTTASVFDIESLNYLINGIRLPYELPFIKIANRRDLDWLIDEIPRKYKVYKSVESIPVVDWQFDRGIEKLWCVSEYPAPIKKYPDWCRFISDHTVGLDLWYRNKPIIWEKHFKLSDSTGLDAGYFAITPTELKEIL